MWQRYNPFQPHKTIYPGMFAGRVNELFAIDKALYQTKENNPSNIMFVGERGIGKSSLLYYAELIAKGEIDGISGQTYNYLTAKVSLNEKINIKELCEMIKSQIERAFGKENKAIDYMKKIWAFAQRLQALGISLTQSENSGTDQKILNDLIYSISDTVKALVSDTATNELGLTKKKDGLVIFIDEADKAGEQLQLGSFLKNLTETLSSEQINNLLIVIAGLPKLTDVLRRSHPSSLRIFEKFDLKKLNNSDVKQIIERGIKISNDKSQKLGLVKINVEALSLIYKYSEGYPHFVQQIGKSVFDFNNDEIIDTDDVTAGYFGRGSEQGALKIIGDAYYIDTYNNCSKSEKEILDIIATKRKDWMTLDEMKKQFKGSPGTLRGTLSKLAAEEVIIRAEDVRGSYRLQTAAFVFWIKMMSLARGST